MSAPSRPSIDRSPAFWPPAPGLVRDRVTVPFAGRRYLGHLVAPPAAAGPRPLVLVAHNYQGLKFFDVHVAEYLARVGYVGLAIDLYGDRVPVDEREFPTDRPERIPAFQTQCFAAMVAMDHDRPTFRGLMDAWRVAGLAHPSVDASRRPAAIGYCFGGVAVLEAVRGGLDFSAVVSLHGLLQTGEDPNPERFGVQRPPLVPCEDRHGQHTVLLVENGAEDHLVTDDNMKRFFDEMNGAGVEWLFHQHARAPHGFALPPTLGAPGHLHEATDRRSTLSMLALFREVFPGVVQQPVHHNAAGTAIPA
ncbi:MAG: dienelactone hydrolase family protein [Pseudomonadales bacterium]|jgi:dienelactone hydrolase|nr:dienelactone hydrolase family protein [Pseudomonadales bacterium]